ncbi:MAG: proline dehydrogenase family protein [Candidatus Kryptonium sp.]
MNPLNEIIVRTLPFVPKKIVRYFASRYIAGEKLEDAVSVVKKLNEQNKIATIDVLGENITSESEAIEALKTYKLVLNTIKDHGLNSDLSIKLTQLGLKLDFDFCYANVEELVKLAKQYDNIVEIDMEDSSTTDATLEIYRKLKMKYDNVGVAIQAYLKRSESDIKALLPLKPRIRLCKGIYIEPETIAFKKKELINHNFKHLLNILLQSDAYTCIATHDEELIKESYKLIKEYNLKDDKFEFQMLLGVRPELGNKIVSDGYKLRIYVPFGEHWYAYSMRRFRENPQIAGYVFKAIFTKNSF